MTELEQELQQITTKLQLLLKQNSSNRKKVQQLLRENKQLQQQLNDKNQLNEQLNERVAAMKLGSITATAAEKKELEKKINGYLREIDKCLALLNQSV